MKKMFLVLMAAGFCTMHVFAAGSLDDLAGGKNKKDTSNSSGGKTSFRKSKDSITDSYFYDSKDKVYNMKEADAYKENPLGKGRFLAVTGYPVRKGTDVLITSGDSTFYITNMESGKVKINQKSTFNIVITEKVSKNEYKVEVLLPLPKEELMEYKKNGGIGFVNHVEK